MTKPGKAQPVRKTPAAPPPGWSDPLAPQQPLVSPLWLLKTFGLALAAALVCAYLALCLLFYQGRWQLLYHPSRTLTATPASAGLRYDDLRFDYTETGAAQLAGWWIPAEPGSRYPSATLLYLHTASGNLSDTVGRLRALHALGLNVFAFDYRGFGQSAKQHPSEKRVYEDADAAIAYLAETRHIDPRFIVLYGEGLGANIAAEAALRHPQIPAVILDGPAPPALEQLGRDARNSILPVRLLVTDRFDLAPRLAALKTPKLLLANGHDSGFPHDRVQRFLDEHLGLPPGP